MIHITDKIFINENKIKYTAIKSSGPGGQNINKVSTAIILQYDLKDSTYPEWLIDRIKTNFKKRLSKKEVLTIKTNLYKSQIKNKKKSLNILIDIFIFASNKPKIRKKTLIPFKSKRKRSLLKKKNSVKKFLRKSPNFND